MDKPLNNKGFTLIELMIVVVIIGILAAVSIPNFISMQDRAKEAGVRSNCHTTRLASEEFAVENGGVYATNPDVDVTSLGSTIYDLLPAGGRLVNPFTKAATEPVAGAAATAGQVGYEVLVDALGINVGARITGFGKSTLIITMSSGS